VHTSGSVVAVAVAVKVHDNERCWLDLAFVAERGRDDVVDPIRR
jgi:hypothetical protein